jgi:type II secretory pathway pseudopilin PulG
MCKNDPSRRAPSGESGFTLVEALVAIVVLVFGLMAVTNLMIVAASSNSVANQGTAAVTSATRIMDVIKSTSFDLLPVGGTPIDPADTPAPKACDDPTLTLGTDWHCNDIIPGVGTIHTHWRITPTTDVRVLHIRVQSEGLGAMSGARSRSDFTSFRACTNINAGCPDPALGGPGPSPSPTP